MIYGYARCSTNEERQDINRQKRELYTLGVTDEKYIYWEYESGMKDENDMKNVKEQGADAVLIGETFMRSDYIKETMKQLRSCL